MKLVECVPNFSEGRNLEIISQIKEAISKVNEVKLLSVEPGEATNRTVFTFVGTPESVVEGAFRGIKKAYELIDMSKHKGAHPRMGACDVCPFVPLEGVTMEECIELARKLGKRVAEELNLPVYLYGEAASVPVRKDLSYVRCGEYEGLPQKLATPEGKPDFGPAEFNSKFGACIIGARPFLIAYNVNLNTKDKKLAHEIASTIRESGKKVKDKGGEVLAVIPGRLKAVKAVGWYIEEYGFAQVSINLLDYTVTPLYKVFEVVKEEAEKLGLFVTGSEIVGLVPKQALIETGEYFIEKQKKPSALSEMELIEFAILSLGLNSIEKFIPGEKIIEYRLHSRPLTGVDIGSYLDRLSSPSPVPGGGSVAALSVALGYALLAMVVNLSLGKKKTQDTLLKEIGKKAQQGKDKLLEKMLKDEDAFLKVMEAYKIPRNSPERQSSLEEALLGAAGVPFSVLSVCKEVMEMANQLLEYGNPNCYTDALVAKECALCGARSAFYNVKVNLENLSLRKEEGEALLSEAANLLKEIEKCVYPVERNFTS